MKNFCMTKINIKFFLKVTFKEKIFFCIYNQRLIIRIFKNLYKSLRNSNNAIENGQKAWTDNFQRKEFKWHAKLPAWLLIKEVPTKMKGYSLVNHETSGGESHPGIMCTVTTPGRKWPGGSVTASVKPHLSSPAIPHIPSCGSSQTRVQESWLAPWPHEEVIGYCVIRLLREPREIAGTRVDAASATLGSLGVLCSK